MFRFNSLFSMSIYYKFLFVHYHHLNSNTDSFVTYIFIMQLRWHMDMKL